MTELNRQFSATTIEKKQPFDAEKITEVLMFEPCNVDINDIIHTPNTVVCNVPRETYVSKRIGFTIRHKFNVDVTCEDDKIIFSSKETSM